MTGIERNVMAAMAIDQTPREPISRISSNVI
ncbi:hypothetical protein ABID58_006086 [Bradyrhizobium sp. S3.2.6]